MKYKKQIYTIRKDSCLATDNIKPYGDRIEVYSESQQRELVLKLLDFPEENHKEESEAVINN